MFADNFYIIIQLNKSLDIASIDSALSELVALNGVKPGLFGFHYSTPEVDAPTEYYQGYVFFKEFYLDAREKEDDSLAYFAVTYYSPGKDSRCGVISISAFNHPAGYIIMDQHQEMSKLLKLSFEKTGAFDLLLFCNDPIDLPPLILNKYLIGVEEKDNGIEYALR